MFNRIIIKGHIAADIEFYPANGEKKALARFRVINNESSKPESRKFAANCTAFGQRAEHISKFYAKGSAIIVEGSIYDTSWEKKDGGTGYGTEVIVSDTDFADSKKPEAPDAAPAPAPEKASAGKKR